ncbi:MAG: aldo/keto reductase, partial [Euryarchaeota archaeon]|nr:aldo/keto reductase [Euryarchaeota archaeon]
MLYRKLGKTGVDVSILGFGCMRLPTRGGNPEDIDEALATKMLH